MILVADNGTSIKNFFENCFVIASENLPFPPQGLAGYRGRKGHDLLVPATLNGTSGARRHRHHQFSATGTPAVGPRGGPAWALS
jgi:hypothetical protein